jgi:tyrosine-protein kinase Etk/Wzc
MRAFTPEPTKLDTEIHPDTRNGEVSLLEVVEVLTILAKARWLIAKICLAVAIITSVIVLLIPNSYVAKVRILPPQQSQSISTIMLGQLGPLAGLANKELNLRNPNDTFVAMLKSRTVAERIISDFRYRDVYGTKTLTDTLLKLNANTEITSNRDGTIDVEFEDRDPVRAAQVANAYIRELTGLSKSLSITEASRRRVFFEQQLRGAKDDLALAEASLKKLQERTGLIEPSSQARAIIEAVATVRAQIAAKEVQIASMASFATPTNPAYIQVQQELNALRAQLAKLQRDTNRGDGDTQVATRNVPEVGLEYVRRLRDVKYNEALFEVLSKQYEIARIDEAKDSALIQVLDPAIPPERKENPKRTLIVLVATGLAFLIAASFVLFRALLVDRLDAPTRQNFRDLRTSLRGN